MGQFKFGAVCNARKQPSVAEFMYTILTIIILYNYIMNILLYFYITGIQNLLTLQTAPLMNRIYNISQYLLTLLIVCK